MILLVFCFFAALQAMPRGCATEGVLRKAPTLPRDHFSAHAEALKPQNGLATGASCLQSRVPPTLFGYYGGGGTEEPPLRMEWGRGGGGIRKKRKNWEESERRYNMLPYIASKKEWLTQLYKELSIILALGDPCHLLWRYCLII